MKYLIATLLLLCSTAANAWNCAENPAYWYLNVSGNECYHQGPAPTLPGYPASAGGTQSQTQGQGQTQTNGQGQTQGITGSGNSRNANTSSSTTGPVTVSVSPSSMVSSSTSSTSSSSASLGSVSAQGGAATGGSARVGNTSTGASTSSATSQGSMSTSGGNVYDSTYAAARIPVPTALAGAGITTAGCRFAEGLGVQTMPAGTSLGFSFKDHDCVRFQLAQFLYGRGQNAAADKVLCQIADIKAALGPDCLAVIAVVPPAPVAQAPVDAVTHAELQQIEKRIVTRMSQK